MNGNGVKQGNCLINNSPLVVQEEEYEEDQFETLDDQKHKDILSESPPKNVND
jgi:hypothetical protein